MRRYLDEEYFLKFLIKLKNKVKAHFGYVTECPHPPLNQTSFLFKYSEDIDWNSRVIKVLYPGILEVKNKELMSVFDLSLQEKSSVYTSQFSHILKFPMDQGTYSIGSLHSETEFACKYWVTPHIVDEESYFFFLVRDMTNDQLNDESVINVEPLAPELYCRMLDLNDTNLGTFLAGLQPHSRDFDEFTNSL